MLLVIALGFGREVLQWWHDDTPPHGTVNSRYSATPPDTAGGQVLAFGNQSWSIRRQEFTGPRAGVPAALVAFCQSAIADAAPHGDSADAAERDLLKRLAAEKPVAEEPGRWRLYQWSEGLPIVAGTRRVPDTVGTSLAEPPYRVVIWGMGVPVADPRPASGYPGRPDAWTLYVFQAARAKSGPEQGAARVPLPPGSRRLATVGSADGSITAFSAENDLSNSARLFYDGWFAEHGWVAAARWQRSAAGWQARFESATGSPSRTADIRLGSDPQGKCTGLIMESGKR